MERYKDLIRSRLIALDCWRDGEALSSDQLDRLVRDVCRQVPSIAAEIVADEIRSSDCTLLAEDPLAFGLRMFDLIRMTVEDSIGLAMRKIQKEKNT